MQQRCVSAMGVPALACEEKVAMVSPQPRRRRSEGVEGVDSSLKFPRSRSGCRGGARRARQAVGALDCARRRGKNRDCRVWAAKGGVAEWEVVLHGDTAAISIAKAKEEKWWSWRCCHGCGSALFGRWRRRGCRGGGCRPTEEGGRK